MSSSLAISHRPYGFDGLYDTQPDERFPRDPAGGDMVAIGFLTSPGRAAENVALHWARNGRPQAPILARPVSRGTDADRWLVELGVVEADDSVEYWVDRQRRGAERPDRALHVRRAALAAAGRRSAPPSRWTDGLRLATRGDDGAPGPAADDPTGWPGWNAAPAYRPRLPQDATAAALPDAGRQRDVATASRWRSTRRAGA